MRKIKNINRNRKTKFKRVIVITNHQTDKYDVKLLVNGKLRWIEGLSTKSNAQKIAKFYRNLNKLV